MLHITTATTTTHPESYGLLIQVNAALTGTITLSDSNGTQAIITNPGVGAQFRYWGFTGQISIVTSATCDITVSALNHQG